MSAEAIAELARLGTATVFEASGRRGLIDAPLHQIVPGSRVAGPARTARCGQVDNLMVHAAMASLQPGEVLVLTMPSPEPVALVGDLLATQAKVHGAAAILVDAAVRDVEELVELGLPIWARYVRIRGADKATAGELDIPVEVGGATIRPGDIVILDADGAAVVEHERVDEVLEASLAREEAERVKRAKLQAGELDVPVEVGGAPIRPGDIVILDADGAAVVEHERVDEVLDASLAREEAERVKRAKLQAGELSYDLDGLRAIVEEGRESTPPSTPVQGTGSQ